MGNGAAKELFDTELVVLDNCPLGAGLMKLVVEPPRIGLLCSVLDISLCDMLGVDDLAGLQAPDPNSDPAELLTREPENWRWV